MKKYCVYIHETPSGKKYVGITCRKPEYRWSHGNGYKPNKHFYSAILRYGWENISHCIVAKGLEKRQACDLEKELIRKYESNNPLKGYNNSTGGDGGTTGIKRSKESIEKRLAHRKYESSWAKGKHFSEEHRRKIGEAHRGMRHTEEAKKKMSIAHKGKTNGLKGINLSDERRAKTSSPVMCVETGVRYFGLMEAERQTGINHSNISNCLSGKREIAGGYHWKRA